MNSENKESLSNYQLLKRKPSVCSTSLHFSKLITVVQLFFRVTPVLQWFQLNFGAGNFRGRLPGTNVLRMLLRLIPVKRETNILARTQVSHSVRENFVSCLFRKLSRQEKHSSFGDNSLNNLRNKG